MANFKNTIDVLGDDAVIDSIIQKTIPEYKDDTISEVGQYAFYGCAVLAEVDLPNVETIGQKAFCKTPALKKLNVPKATKFHGYTFQETSPFALEEIVCPNVALFGAQAIMHTAVKKLDVHVVTMFQANALPDSLQTLILRSKDGVSTLNYALSNCNPSIYVPSALYDSYKAASNWSTYANQFRKLEEWTVDGTVTGELATNKHMVRFFDSDGTLLGYKIVTTGGSATWDGATLVDPSGNGYPFEGWSPAPTNVRADMDCYPQFENPLEVAEITDSWEQIMAAVADGTAGTKYKVGNYKPMDLGAEGIINMQIAGFHKDAMADGSGTAAITWISKELLTTTHRMNGNVYTNDDGTYQEGTGAIGGWEKCEMRVYLKETIKPLMLEVVRNSIKEVTKTHEAYDTAGTKFYQTSIEDVWVPNYNEIYESSSPYKVLFPNNASTKKCRVGNTSANSWWLRSACGADYFYYASSGGNSSNINAYKKHGVCLCFCT